MPIEQWRKQHPLESPIWKIHQAERHIEAINQYVHLWESLEPNGMRRHLNADNTFYEYTLVAIYPPLIDFGIAIGEFAYQLRSALDQIVYAMSLFPTNLRGNALESAERSTSFPIMRSRDDDRIWSLLQYVPENIRGRAWEAINLVQPYQRGSTAEQDPLALLDQMNIRDKHRILAPATSGFTIDQMNIDPRIQTMQGSVKNGDIVARVPADLDPEADFDRRITRVITIPITRPTGGIQLARIAEIYACVAFDVLPRFFDLFEPLPAAVRVPSPADSQER